MDDETLLKQFENCTFPLEQWHHAEHIKVADLYLRRHPLEAAVEKIRTGLKGFVAAHHVPDAPDSGYHETMTQAWVRLVYLVLCEYGPADTAGAFLEQHPELSQKKTLRLFYSRERFMSPQAKREFIAPDLAPLPKSRREAGPGGIPPADPGS